MIDDIAKDLARHKLVPFFGAGVSAEHVGVVWKDISDAMADELGLSATDRSDFLDVAELYEQRFGKSGLCDFLSGRLLARDFNDARGRNHLLLLGLGAGVLYTTNQDNVFELAAATKGRLHRIIIELSDLGALLPGEFALVKYHGDLAKADSVIFTRNSYQQRIKDPDHFLNIRLRSDLLAKGLLFIGYSFNDPNVQFLFEQMHAAFRGKTPPSYLIAYEYKPAMEELTKKFGVRIVNPLESFRSAKDGAQAFELYLSTLNKKVVECKAAVEIGTVFRSAVPPSVRVATTYDVTAIEAIVHNRNFKDGMSAFRASVDRTLVPDDLRERVCAAFRALADQAKTVGELQNLAAALFNLQLPPEYIVSAAVGIIVAINRVNSRDGILPFLLVCPAGPDWLMAAAAALAIVEIKEEGGTINDGFRTNAAQWLHVFEALPDNLKDTVIQMMQVAWRDGGSEFPTHRLGKGSRVPVKSFSDFKNDLQSMIPKRFVKPYE